MATSTSPTAFQLDRRMQEARSRAVRLAARQWLTPEYVRVRLEGAERWRLDAERVVVKGYWKRGESEYHAPH